MNLYDASSPPLCGEVLTTLLEHKNVKINRIVSSDTLEEKIYIQEEDEWLVLLEGEAILDIDNHKKELNKGDTLFIPAGTPHQVSKTKAGTIWLTVHIF